MNTIRFCDLFAGVGGFRVGLENANKYGLEASNKLNTSTRDKNEKNKPNSTRSDGQGRRTHSYACVWSNEWDKYAAQIYTKHFGECDTRDIRTVKSGEIPDFDLVCGGVPCQSWSIAGKRGGFEDERGNMWFECFRIVREKQSKFFLFENVKGLLSHDGGKSMERICEELCGCGYAIDFEVLNSKNFGVPQNRQRVYIVGVRLDLLDKNQIF